MWSDDWCLWKIINPVKNSVFIQWWQTSAENNIKVKDAEESFYGIVQHWRLLSLYKRLCPVRKHYHLSTINCSRPHSTLSSLVWACCLNFNNQISEKREEEHNRGPILSVLAENKVSVWSLKHAPESAKVCQHTWMKCHPVHKETVSNLAINKQIQRQTAQ